VPDLAKWLVMFVVAYFVGSISFALVLGRLKGVDVRAHGSGNVGATNVGRVLGRNWGWLCFVLDVLKGLLPVLGTGAWLGLLGEEARITPLSLLLWLAVGVTAILGHMFSIFIGFRGGKGVATGFGALLGIHPILTWPVLGAIAVWLAVLGGFRWGSLASMAAATSVPVWWVLAASLRGGGEGADAGFMALLATEWPAGLVTVLLAALVIWKHRANIGRIRSGTEPRIGRGTTPVPDGSREA